MRERVKQLLLVSLCVLVLSGCSKEIGKADVSQPDTLVSTEQAMGDAFLAANLKIKSTISDVSVDPKRTATVELYVDGDGDGKGLLGFGEKVFDVVVVNDTLYVKIDEGVVVGVNDISGRLVLSDTKLSGQSDMKTLGFKVTTDNIPVSYDARKDSTVVSTAFAQSVNTFETASIIATSTMGFTEMLTYIMDYEATQFVSVDSPDDDSKEVTDFYIKSKYGIDIEGSVFSIGDTCNPSSYFRGSTPEGVLVSSKYKEDTRVDFEHVSYISDTGRTVFVLTNNYVQAINTTADFNFLGITRGMTDKELKYILGYKLSNKDAVDWSPVDPGLQVTDYRSNTYYCTIGNLNVEFRLAKSALQEIYVEQKLDFKG